MTLQKKDFVEINFTGRTKDGEVFDSTIKEEFKKTGIKGNPKPFVFCLGEKMFLESIENFLLGKEIGKYKIELKPEEAFGKRDPKKIQMIPVKIFNQHQIRPIAGASFNFDGQIAKILNVSGGRTLVDFNLPLAGKEVFYEIEVLRKIEDLNEKVKSLNEFFFRQEFEFILEGKKLKLKVPEKLQKFVEIFKDKYKEILGLDLEVEAISKEILENPKEKVKE